MSSQTNTPPHSRNSISIRQKFRSSSNQLNIYEKHYRTTTKNQVNQFNSTNSASSIESAFEPTLVTIPAITAPRPAPLLLTPSADLPISTPDAEPATLIVTHHTAIDDPYGLDIPYDPIGPSTRAPNGQLPNDWNAVDNLHLNSVLVSSFSHLRIVPRAAMAPWTEALTLAMNRLVAAIEQPISADRRLIIRRALMWYAILPALILRVVGQNSLKTSNTVVKRCY